jgi:hypothetical protein
MLGMTFDIQTHLALFAVSGTGSLSGLPTKRELIGDQKGLYRYKQAT